MQLLGTIDLTSLSRALQAEGVHPELVKAVGLAAAVGSIRDDLLDAAAGLRLIDKFTTSEQSDADTVDRTDASTTVGALFDHAIILYARATTPKGERLSLIGTPKDPDDRALHDEVLRLRSSVVAHFGRGDLLTEGPFYKEAVILNVFAVGTEQKHQVSVYTQRTANRVRFARRLAVLIDHRLADVMERFEPLQISVRNSLDEALANDLDLFGRLAAYEFDIDGFFATKGFAEHYRQWVEKGGVSGRQTDATHIPPS